MVDNPEAVLRDQTIISATQARVLLKREGGSQRLDCRLELVATLKRPAEQIKRKRPLLRVDCPQIGINRGGDRVFLLVLPVLPIVGILQKQCRGQPGPVIEVARFQCNQLDKIGFRKRAVAIVERCDAVPAKLVDCLICRAA